MRVPFKKGFIVFKCTRLNGIDCGKCLFKIKCKRGNKMGKSHGMDEEIEKAKGEKKEYCNGRVTE